MTTAEHDLHGLCNEIIKSVTSVFVGDRLLVEKVLAAALANGHVLFEDYPGLGKTLLAKAFARAIGGEFHRVQFTPDLLPADILGTRIWQQRESTFELVKGPIFTNILLSDEINRAPPKAQSALLEGMEERQVTIDGETHILSSPFVVLATQNPIEQEGTYPLPEAQMDRFMLRLSTGYAATLEDEIEVLNRRISWHQDDPTSGVSPVASDFAKLQEAVERTVYIDPSVLEYIGRIVRETRDHPNVEIGSSPRGGLALLKASRALAFIRDRDFVVPDDIKAIATNALAHRLILHTEVVLDGGSEAAVVEEILSKIPAPTEFRERPDAAMASPPEPKTGS